MFVDHKECAFLCSWNSSFPRQLCGQWRRWHPSLGSHIPVVSGLRPSRAGVCKDRYQRTWELEGRGRCFHPSSHPHNVDTVSAPFPQVPSILLCSAFSSQRSLLLIAGNDDKLCIVLSFIVIVCVSFLSRPTPFQGQSTG